MGKIIVVASGKGGTGKTTFSANIGAALACKGILTVLVDMDIGLRNLDIALGLENSVVYDISDVAGGICSLDDVLMRVPDYENLYFVPSSQMKNASALDAEKITGVLRSLRDRFDYCLIDAPAGIEGGFAYAKSVCDSAVIVTAATLSALRDADRVVSELEENSVGDIKLVINKIRPDLIESGAMMKIDKCADMLRIPVTGLIPDDDRLISLAAAGKLAISDAECVAGKAFMNIADRIMGKAVPVMNIEKKKDGLFKRIVKAVQNK